MLVERVDVLHGVDVRSNQKFTGWRQALDKNCRLKGILNPQKAASASHEPKLTKLGWPMRLEFNARAELKGAVIHARIARHV